MARYVEPVHLSKWFAPWILMFLSLIAACGGGSSNPEVVIDDEANQSPDPAIELAPVSNLRGVVYTNTEIELFWDRAADDSGVLAFEIVRDGVLLERRDGLSFYDGGLQPGTTYTYSVSTVGDGESRGMAVEISLKTLPDEPEITVAKSSALLDYVLAIANESLLYDWVEQVKPAEGGITTPGFDNGEFTLYECVDGGTATTRPYGSAQSGGTSTDYVACRSPDTHTYVQIDGNYSTRFALSKLVTNVGLFNGNDYDLSAISSAGGALRLTGEDGRFDGENSDTATRKINLSAAGFAGTTTINAELDLIAGTGDAEVREPYERILSGVFTVQSPQTGNRLLSADFSEEPVSLIDGGCYETGQLRVEAVDAGQLLVNFDTGNATTFEMVVVNGDQTTSSILNWSDMFISLDDTQRAAGLISAVC